jgi:putative ABC transport system ATP-binding protein
MTVPVVDAHNVNLSLMSGGRPLHILKDVSLTVKPGEVVATVGPSGSGKTSLMMVLSGLQRASSGSVVVAGSEISGLNEDQLAVFRRQTLGIIFQNFNLISSLTALENVRLALEIAETGLRPDKVAAASTEALRKVGLGDRVTHLPGALSGGEQQRVGLARAMVTNPRLLLADEPTGNLDQDSGDLVIELMFSMARQQGAAVLLITHDHALASRADRRLEMNHGRLTEQLENARQ